MTNEDRGMLDAIERLEAGTRALRALVEGAETLNDGAVRQAWANLTADYEALRQAAAGFERAGEGKRPDRPGAGAS